MWASSERREAGVRPRDTRSHPAPSRVGRYAIGELLGAGSMGVVYRAYDPRLDRTVAIKLLRADASGADQARLLREAQAMAQLWDRHVVPILDVGLTGGIVFIAMPVVEGGTLRGWLAREPRSFDAILERFVAAGHGLAAAHAACLVHRDFKPDNVMLDGNGEVLVADFGLARVVTPDAGHGPDPGPRSASLLDSGDVVGTPAYMPPEQQAGLPADARADQFSFCVALWEGLYGRLPFAPPASWEPGALRTRLDAIAAGPRVPERRDRPAWIAPLLVRGLALDPAQRWPTMQALLHEIAAHRAARPRSRRWRSAAALSAIALTVAAVFGMARLARARAAPRFHLAAVVAGEKLKSATVSPDGSELAVVRGDALVIRRNEPDGQDRVLVEHGIAPGPPPVWTPDGKRVLASLVPEVAGEIRTVLVDVADGVQHAQPVPGMAAVLSNAEIAIASYRQHHVEIFAIGEPTPIATCPVAGDYAVVLALSGLPDGTMIVHTLDGETHTLIILRRDCEVRATYAAENLSSFAVSDTGTIVALISGDGFRDLVEISLDGQVVSRRSVSGDVDTVLARHRGIDYLAQHTLKTRLDPIIDEAVGRALITVDGTASFALAPDGDTLAWIEHTGQDPERGTLWRSSLRDGLRTRERLHDSALMAGWSPDGKRLAVLTRDDRGRAIDVVGRDGGARRRLPLRHLAGEAAPVWLDDHRILVQADDWLTYWSFDLDRDEQREALDRDHGGTYWVARSPRDGRIVMWRNGPPGAPGAPHLWSKAIDGVAEPLPIADAVRHHLSPSWSRIGELYVRALETGEVSRVDQDDHTLHRVATLPETPVNRPFDNRLMFSADGGLLAVDIEVTVHLWTTVPDENLRALQPTEPGQL